MIGKTETKKIVLCGREIQCTVVRSGRKTAAVQIKPDGQIIVRMPVKATENDVLRVMEKSAGWIFSHLEKAETRRSEAGGEAKKLTHEEIGRLKVTAAQVIPGRAAFYAEKLGVTYGRITVRCQRTKWGSCSSKGNLNFNCLLMLAPPEVLDSVVVHELCHRIEMNHSARFYSEVRRVFPGYDVCRKWLKQNGPSLIKRIPD